MEKTEPTFVPEWLKNSGGSSTTSDEQSASKSVRNKSLDNGLGHPSVSYRTNSSNSRRASINHGSARLRSYSSFNRNHRDRNRDRDKDSFEFRNKETSVNRHYDHSDPLGNILPSRFEKNGLRRSHSSAWPKKVASDLTIGNKISHTNGGSGSSLSGNVKISFERDFPSLGADEKQVDPPPGLSSAIHSLPTAVIGGDGWTSALAEVPVIVGSSGNGSSVAPLASVSATVGMTGGRNMAETLAHGPPRTQTPPQLTLGPQRLEELAVKQSRQLIPVTPSMPKSLGLNSSDKHKLKIGQSHFQSSHLNNNPNTPRPVAVKPDASKTSSTVGKLLVLKPSRERNGVTPTAKDSLSPTAGGTKLPNSPLAAPPTVGSAPLKNSATLEKRPSLQAQSRNNFFNLMRKKSMASSSNPSSVAPENHAESGSGSTVVQQSSETKVDLASNGGDAPVVNGKKHSGLDAILYSEEEEARFLRSLGWEENDEEDEEGLTEEEISSFYQNYLHLKPSASKVLKGALQTQ